MEKVICNWFTYKGSQCRRNINHIQDKNSRYCSLHKELIENYKKIKNDTEDNLCETFEKIKIIPRSYKHLKAVMESMNNEDENVEVYMPGGSIEEASISNNEYITLLSDNCNYYYKNIKNANKTKNLKIILTKYCQNSSIISVGDDSYCEECYKKLKNVPKLSLIE